MNKSKSLFLIILMIGTLITMSSTNWISMWMGLEMNMIAFIPLISTNKNKSSSEASMMYFLVQSVSSMILLFSIIMMIMEMQLFNLLLTLSVLIKLGAAPFHMWVPEIMAKMTWPKCLLLMTWQKLAPLSMMNNIQQDNKIMFVTIILSVILGAVGGLNQTSLRKIMGYSSINHLGWMLSLNKIQNNWLTYLCLYTLMMILLCSMFNHHNMLFINQMNMINMSMYDKMTYTISLMSLGGLPPFLGFLPKWMVIQTLTNDKSFFMLFVMIMFSLITLYYYLRITTSMMLNFSTINKWIVNNNNDKLNSLIMTINLSLPIILVFNFI